MTTPEIRPQTVDVHTHRWDSSRQLGAAAARWVRDVVDQPWQRVDASMSAFKEAMKPVRFAVIHGFKSAFLDACIPADRVAGYVAEQPSKYVGFAGIDPLAPGWQEDLQQAMDLGLVGVTISPSGQNFHPTHTRAMRLYEQCEKLGIPILVHAGTHLGTAVKLEYDQPYLFDEPAQSFPELRMVLSQVGQPWIQQAIVLISKHRHVYADLSRLTAQPWNLYQTLVCAYQEGAIGSLLFGSDFPFMTPQQAILAIYSVNTLTHGTMLPTIPREQLRSVVERNALACLNIPSPAKSNHQAPSSADSCVDLQPPGANDQTTSSSHEITPPSDITVT